MIGYATRPAAYDHLLHYHGTMLVPARPFQTRGAQRIPDRVGLCNVS